MSPKSKKQPAVQPLLIIPTKTQIDIARAREEEMTTLFTARYGRKHLNDSITEGEGMLAGLVGEEIFRDQYNLLRSEGEAIYHYDVLDPLWLGKIDVKTKRCTSEPKPHYNCSVAASNTTQQCDYYAFVRVLKDFTKAWILGLVPKTLFFEQALFFKRGQIDPSGFGGWRFKWDCFNLQIGELWTPPPKAAGFNEYKHRPAEHPDFNPDILPAEENE
jgi:hypothetical protein